LHNNYFPYPDLNLS